MKRYFFDVVGPQRSEYDYSGQYMPTPENACGLAELMAIDLALQPEEPWVGWTIKVRNAEGHEFFSVLVQASYLAAA